MKAIGAFDAAWAEISNNFGDDKADVEKPRPRLANALLSIASEDSREVEVLKRAVLASMALDYKRRRQEEGSRVRASRFACSSDSGRSMSPPKRVERTAKGALRAGAILSMQSFTGEVGRATFGGRYLRCELEGTSRSTTALLLTGEAARKCNVALHV